MVFGRLIKKLRSNKGSPPGTPPRSPKRGANQGLPMDDEDDVKTLAAELSTLIALYEKQQEDAAKQYQEMNQKLAQQHSDILQRINPKVLETDDPEEILADVPPRIIQHGDVAWSVAGFSSTAPVNGIEYFPTLNGFMGETMPGTDTRRLPISVIIPCFNEDAEMLHRTVVGLGEQEDLEDCRVEAVIIMDGATHMSPTTQNYLNQMFGVNFNSGDPETDPLLMFPEAETIIVHPADNANANRRAAVSGGALGGYSLIVKRRNHRKANR